jgi:hypothetical protein
MTKEEFQATFPNVESAWLVGTQWFMLFYDEQAKAYASESGLKLELVSFKKKEDDVKK